MAALDFGIAAEPDEIRQIYALNYRTFVEEIPQHAPNPERLLQDKFDAENTYFVCRRGRDVVGMIALRSARPFSLDAKLPNLDTFLPPHQSACEIRLLAIRPDCRRGRILLGLMAMVYRFFESRGHDLALISGTLRQRKLYARLGFVPFGPVVGTADAPYQPMYQFIGEFRRLAHGSGSAVLGGLLRGEVNLLPGPVVPSPPVRAALGAKPQSHRSEAFSGALSRLRQWLCRLTNAPSVAVALGSGTLANDLVAGQIAQMPGSGLILCHGEFGRRLTDHATRFGLDFEVLEGVWGTAFTEAEVAAALARGSRKSWLWAVHAETSTGVLTDPAMLKRLARDNGVRLCLDCVSSLGIVEVDLRGVALASGVSGKGLASMAGLALVFHDGNLAPTQRPLPRYLDLNLYTSPEPPFTLPSNLVQALQIALEQLDIDARAAAIRDTAAWLDGALRGIGLPPLAQPSARFPGVFTVPLPQGVDALAVGDALEQRGWLVSCRSRYLAERNWIQICLYSSADRASIERLLPLLRRCAST